MHLSLEPVIAALVAHLETSLPSGTTALSIRTGSQASYHTHAVQKWILVNSTPFRKQTPEPEIQHSLVLFLQLISLALRMSL